MKIDETYITQLTNTVAKTILEAFESLTIEDVNMYQLGYNESINNFIHECDKYCGYYEGKNRNLTREDILNIAKQLKGRMYNEFI